MHEALQEKTAVDDAANEFIDVRNVGVISIDQRISTTKYTVTGGLWNYERKICHIGELTATTIRHQPFTKKTVISQLRDAYTTTGPLEPPFCRGQ